MALSKVGTSPAVIAYGKAAGDTITVTFTADTTFAEDDLLIFFLSTGAKSAGSTYTHLPGTGTVNTATTGAGTTHVGTWQEGQVFFQNTPYWGLVYHFVDASEAGSASISFTVTLGTVDTVGGSTGWMFAQGGVAVRGATSVNTIYVPADNTDTDNVLGTSGASPQTPGPWPSVAPYYSPSAGTLLLYGTCENGLATAATAMSVAFTGPTEIDDDFSANLMPTNVDVWLASAYELLGPSDNYPADNITFTWTASAGNLLSYAWRAIISLDAAAPATPTLGPRYEIISRRISMRDLPYEVTRRMFGG